jgi:hypothetical protein
MRNSEQGDRDAEQRRQDEKRHQEAQWRKAEIRKREEKRQVCHGNCNVLDPSCLFRHRKPVFVAMDHTFKEGKKYYG